MLKTDQDSNDSLMMALHDYLVSYEFGSVQTKNLLESLTKSTGICLNFFEALPHYIAMRQWSSSTVGSLVWCRRYICILCSVLVVAMFHFIGTKG